VRVSTDGRSERFGHGDLKRSGSVATVLAGSLLYQNNNTATSDCRTELILLQRTAEQLRATQPF